MMFQPKVKLNVAFAMIICVNRLLRIFISSPHRQSMNHTSPVHDPSSWIQLSEPSGGDRPYRYAGLYPRHSRGGQSLDSLMGLTFGTNKRLDSLSGMGFGGQKRNFDEIDRSGFNSFIKRNFDEIDRSGFNSFVKKNFDEIDRSGFNSFVKRNADYFAPEEH